MDVESLFRQLDQQGKGRLSLDDLSHFLVSSQNINFEEAQERSRILMADKEELTLDDFQNLMVSYVRQVTESEEAHDYDQPSYTEEEEQLLALFDLADVNGDGDVDVKELNRALKLVGIEDKVERAHALQCLMQELNIDESRGITREEFLHLGDYAPGLIALLSQIRAEDSLAANIASLWEQHFAEKKEIAEEELKTLLTMFRDDLGPAERRVIAKELMDLVDTDDDGSVSKEEFMNAAKRGVMNNYFNKPEEEEVARTSSGFSRAVTQSRRTRQRSSQKKENDKEEYEDLLPQVLAKREAGEKYTEMELDKIHQVHVMFELLVDGGPPVIGVKEFKVILEDPSFVNMSNVTDEYVQKIFSHVDGDGNGELDFEEFLTAFGEVIDDQGKLKKQSGFAAVEQQAARDEIKYLSIKLESKEREHREELEFERKRHRDIEKEQHDFIDRQELHVKALEEKLELLRAQKTATVDNHVDDDGVKRLQSDLSTLKEQERNLIDINRQLEQDLEKQRRTVQNLMKELQDSNVKLVETEDNLEAEKNERQALQESEIALKKMVQDLELKLRDAKSMENEASSQNASMARLQEQLAQSNENVEILKTQLETTKDSETTHKTRAAELELKLKEMVELVGEGNRNLANLTAQLEDQKQLTTEQTNESTQARTEINRLEREVANLQGELEIERQLNAGKGKENDMEQENLKTMLEQRTVHVHDLELALDGERARRQELEQSSERDNSKISDMESEMAKLRREAELKLQTERELQASEGRIAVLEEELSRLIGDLQDNSQVLERSDSVLPLEFLEAPQPTEEIIELAKSEYTDLVDTMQDISNSLQDALDTLARKEEELQLKNEEMRRLRESMSEMVNSDHFEADLAKLRKDLESSHAKAIRTMRAGYEDEIEAMKKTIQQLNNEMDELMRQKFGPGPSSSSGVNREEVDRLTQDLSTLQGRTQGLLEQNQLLTDKLKGADEKHNKELAEKQAQIDELRILLQEAENNQQEGGDNEYSDYLIAVLRHELANLKDENEKERMRTALAERRADIYLANGSQSTEYVQRTNCGCQRRCHHRHTHHHGHHHKTSNRSHRNQQVQFVPEKQGYRRGLIHEYIDN
eukprot:m.199030 g.199030  ORF g.199030 m.199030 type:complete len:1106 (+) comp15722_c1_seq11:148-3465(+)